jgi:hypothetical protein
MSDRFNAGGMALSQIKKLLDNKICFAIMAYNVDEFEEISHKSVFVPALAPYAAIGVNNG